MTDYSILLKEVVECKEKIESMVQKKEIEFERLVSSFQLILEIFEKVIVDMDEEKIEELGQDIFDIAGNNQYIVKKPISDLKQWAVRKSGTNEWSVIDFWPDYGKTGDWTLF